jgi:hypothetical protein
MKIRTTLDVVEIDAAEVDAAIRQLVKEKTGREMVEITWANPREEVRVGAPTRTLVYLNATLKPKAEA